MVDAGSKIGQFTEVLRLFFFRSDGQRWQTRIWWLIWEWKFQWWEMKTEKLEIEIFVCGSDENSESIWFFVGFAFCVSFVQLKKVLISCTTKIKCFSFTFSRANWSQAVRVWTSSLCADWRSCSALQEENTIDWSTINFSRSIHKMQNENTTK